MMTTIELLFFNSFFVSIFMGLLTWQISKKLKSHEFEHLAEFWLSLVVMMGVGYGLRFEKGPLLAVNFLAWLWPIKAIMQITEDLSGISFFRRIKVITLATGGFFTMALATYGQPFMIYSLPFCLSVGVVGGMIIGEVYKAKGIKSISILGHVTFSLLGLFFLVRVLYPFWRLNPSLQFAGVISTLFILIGLAASTLTYYMQLIKERHEAQLEYLLKQRNEQLYGQSRYTELGMMSRGIAHEISNPLAIIQARATQLIRTYKDPAKQESVASGLEQILFSSERINRTVQGIREFVHQDERQYDENVQLKDLVDDVLAFCGQRMKNHGVNLRFYNLDHHMLRGHKIQLEQVILNLMNNSFDAIEFLPDKWIEISAEEAPDSIRIYFKDSGSGIPPEIAAHMMEPFYTTKKVGTGTGMGLNLAQTIIEKHGGIITYLDKEKHTTFMIELPKPGMEWRPTKTEGERPTLH